MANQFDSLKVYGKGSLLKDCKIILDAATMSLSAIETISSTLSEQLLPIKHQNRYSFIDTRGNVVISEKYEDYRGRFPSGCSVAVGVKQDGKWGAILPNGQTLIDFEYEHLFPSIVDYTEYRENCAYFEQLFTVFKDHKWGVLDHNGNTFIEFGKYDWIDGYDSGLTRVKKNGKWGLVDYMGAIALPIEYDNIWNFYNRGRVNTKVEKGEIKKNIDFDDLLLKYNEVDCYYDDYDDTSFYSAYDNPYYNDNLDLDQQSIDFWESL